jgi:putative oxidoreductase
VGLATAVAGLPVVLDMLGAALLVHASHGIFAADNGWEVVGAIGAAAWPWRPSDRGRFSIDHAVGTRRPTAVAR